MRLRLLLLAALVLAPAHAPVHALGHPQDAAPDGALEPSALVESAWTLLPPYDGDPRAFLTADERRNARAAAHLFAAACVLAPDDVLAWWRRAHAHALLAEDDAQRGDADAARAERAEAGAALERTIELDATDPWSRYSRGQLATLDGRHEAALDELEAALALCAPRLAEIEMGGADDGSAWLAFKIREWLAEVRMRAGRFDAARDELRRFNADFGENVWPLHIALAESFLRERDFASARGEYQAIVANDAFAGDSQAYALLGYLEGLAGRDADAVARLHQALERERVPDLYLRLWLWILAPQERARVGDELREFLAYPPAETSAWDQTLGRFVLGSDSPAAFIEAAQAEHARRAAAGKAPDDLLCEAWFYAGLRHALDGDPTAARAAYARALAFRPTNWKWEWAYARLFASRTDADLEPDAESDASPEPDPGSAPDPEFAALVPRELALETTRWHVPGTERPVERLGRAPRAGDLLLARIVDRNGRPSWRLFVAGFEND